MEGTTSPRSGRALSRQTRARPAPGSAALPEPLPKLRNKRGASRRARRRAGATKPTGSAGCHTRRGPPCAAAEVEELGAAARGARRAALRRRRKAEQTARARAQLAKQARRVLLSADWHVWPIPRNQRAQNRRCPLSASGSERRRVQLTNVMALESRDFKSGEPASAPIRCHRSISHACAVARMNSRFRRIHKCLAPMGNNRPVIKRPKPTSEIPE